VRRGASWTAAYHLQLTVAAVARPVRSSVGALGVLAAERSWLLLAQTASARRSVQPVSPGPASSPWSTLPAAKPSVGRRCPACGVHPSGIGVRDPAVQPSGVRSPGVVVQTVRRSAVRCPPVRCPAVWCLLRPSGRVRLLPPQAVALGPRSRWPGDRDHGTGGGPCGCRAGDGSIDGRGGRDTGDAAEVGRSVAGPGCWLGAGRGGRACR
jgi:hypothetical protein